MTAGAASPTPEMTNTPQFTATEVLINTPLSPSSLVHIGKGGWYFYTGDNNLEIGMGTYSLTPELLEQIRVTQERI